MICPLNGFVLIIIGKSLAIIYDYACQENFPHTNTQPETTTSLKYQIRIEPWIHATDAKF